MSSGFSKREASLLCLYIILNAQHVAPEIGNHHQTVINIVQPIKGFGSKGVRDLQVRVKISDIPFANKLGHTEQSSLNKCSDHID